MGEHPLSPLHDSPLTYESPSSLIFSNCLQTHNYFTIPYPSSRVRCSSNWVVGASTGSILTQLPQPWQEKVFIFLEKTSLSSGRTMLACLLACWLLILLRKEKSEGFFDAFPVPGDGMRMTWPCLSSSLYIFGHEAHCPGPTDVATTHPKSWNFKKSQFLSFISLVRLTILVTHSLITFLPNFTEALYGSPITPTFIPGCWVILG